MTSPNVKPLPYISTPREARFLANIIYGDSSTKELRGISGSENIWNSAKIMREKGWVIHTINRPVYDRDGKKTHAGYYRLDDAQREHAQTVLNAFYAESQGLSTELLGGRI